MDIMHVSRRASQLFFIVALLLLPVFDILRYDVASKELYLFGNVWGLGLDEAFYSNPAGYGSTYVAMRFVLKAVLPWVIVLSIFPLLGFLLGRTFCGWACPEGAVFEMADDLTLKILGRRRVFGLSESAPNISTRLAYGVVALLYLCTVPPLFGVMLSGYFIAPARIWHEVSSGDLSFGLMAGTIGVACYMIITSIVMRHTICKYLCGAGLMQMLLGWVSPVALGIRFMREDFSRCTDCRECERVCFMDVKPRSNRKDINCVNCGECISACKRELGKDKGLFEFRFRQGRKDASQAGAEKP